jgi:hypothetical protein
MKGMTAYLKQIGATLILLGLLAGCEFLLGPDEKPLPEATEGTITIQLAPGNTGARALFSDDEIAAFEYQVEFLKEGEEEGPVESKGPGTELWIEETREIKLSKTLPLGDWTIIVRAHDGSPGNAVLKAMGKETVTVTPEGSTVHIKMKSSNADLSALKVDNGILASILPLNPNFGPAKTDYSVLVVGTSDIGITATVSDRNATITINEDEVSSGTKKTIGGLTPSMGGTTVTVTIAVTAQDGTTTKTYTVKATRYLL